MRREAPGRASLDRLFRCRVVPHRESCPIPRLPVVRERNENLDSALSSLTALHTIEHQPTNRAIHDELMKVYGTEWLHECVGKLMYSSVALI